MRPLLRTLKEKVHIYLHILCIYFSNPQIVIALLFSCSMACQNCTLLSQERIDCREKNPEWKKLDAYIQIQCHGNGQSCNATCDGATSGNPNTSKFVGVKTQSKPVWQLFPFLPSGDPMNRVWRRRNMTPKTLLVAKQDTNSVEE